jgi:hypothetical protein
MSQSRSQSGRQTWALSKRKNKPSGVCSVCLAVRQIQLKNSTLHQHGPRGNWCPGSNKPPLPNTTQPGGSSSSSTTAPPNSAQHSPPAPVAAVAAATPSTSASTPTPSPAVTTSATVSVASSASTITTATAIVSHPQLNGALIKHILLRPEQHIRQILHVKLMFLC